MTLSDLAALGSFVSGIAVLASLIFLYVQLRQIAQQVRQAEKNQKAAIRQARATQTMDVVVTAMESSAAEAINKGWSGEENISETALRQFRQYCRAAFVGWQDGYYQHLDGLFPETALGSLMGDATTQLGNIGWRTQWRIQRQAFGPQFVAWVDKLAAEAPIDPSVDSLAVWRSALAKERSGAPY